MDEKLRTHNPNPLASAGLFSKFILSWISPLLKAGYTKPLSEHDLYNPVDDQQNEFLTEQLESAWNEEIKNSKSPSLLKVITKIHAKNYLLNNIMLLIVETIRTTQPLIIAELIGYFQGQIGMIEALEYGLILFLGLVVNTFLYAPFNLFNSFTGMKIRIAFSGLIYKKVFKFNMSGKESEAPGRIMNLITNDVAKFENMFLQLPFLIVAPLQTIFFVVAFARLVHVHFLVGISVMVLFIPIQYIIGKLINKFKKLVAAKCDTRISILNEVFDAIKVIKMYCWEDMFKKMIVDIRRKEMNYQGLFYVAITISTVGVLIGQTLMLLISVTYFINFAHIPLTPQLVVLAMSFYMKLNKSLGYYFIVQIQTMISANVCLKRIERFLMEEEILKNNDYIESSKPCIKFENVSSSWESDSNTSCLADINFEIKENEILAVIGSVGSGKSSLLMTLLGEIKSIKGNMKVDGSIFYVQQEPWIFSASLRQNITFGMPYIRKKFNEIVKACSLDEDLKLFEKGAGTIIGEKGINLSGGQRARVSLARALYSDAQIFLLDDPLSAVDANVAKYLYEECIIKYMKNKIRILVTHQIQYLKNANKIILLEGGNIKYSGTYSEFVNHGIKMNLMLDTFERERKDSAISRNSINFKKDSETKYSKNKDCALKKSQINQICIDNNNKEYDESQKLGALTRKTYLEYFKNGGGIFGSLFYFIMLIVSQILCVSGEYWLSYWASQESIDYTNKTSTNFNGSFEVPVFENRESFYNVFLLLTLSSIVAVTIAIICFYSICLNASKNLHKKMFFSIMDSTVRFFDLNPLGRIMNRFSKDIGSVDEALPVALFDFLQAGTMILISVIVIISINYSIIVVIIPLACALVYVRKYFLKSSIEIKRIEGINRSPIYVHLNNTISGLITIRATKIQSKLFQEFNALTDYHTRAVSSYVYINRWFSCRLEWIANTFIFLTVFSSIIIKDFLNISPGQVGIMLVYIFQTLPWFQWCCRQSCEVENLMTSVERIVEYAELDSEPLEDGKVKPLPNWPQSGSIIFKNVSFKYGKNTPNVLNNLNFEIKPQEKIGVVGRTGAGKSTLIQAIFRMAEFDGTILIDGLKLIDLSLHDLRKKLSIITQEPTIFYGTIRSNLDPFNEYSDQDLWDSLKKVRLAETIQEMPKKLESDVHRGGTNLSVGQKQLMCLARAIIKKAKILIIDEATASVDFNTDTLIQSTIRESFIDCTVITIAHRLQTIIDNDRIMCMDNGRLVDFGQPYELLCDKSTILYDLVCKLEETEQRKLMEISKKSVYNERYIE